MRLTQFSSAFASIRDDRYHSRWDACLAEGAAWLARFPEDSAVIAADWGVGTQVFCFANGRQAFVHELFWNYRGRESLEPLTGNQQLNTLAVAALRPPSPLGPEITRRIFADVASAPEWVEIPIEPRIRTLRSMEIRVFRRTPVPSRAGVDPWHANEGAGAGNDTTNDQRD